MKRLFTLLLISFAALSCEMTDENIDDQLENKNVVIFAEGTELTVDVPSEQTVLNYHFESALDWEVKTDAEWLEIDPMSGKAGKDIKIQIKVAKNKDKEGRTGYADLTLSNNESYRITINQVGEGDENDENDVDIPNNQIWYTSIDGEIVEPYSGVLNDYADAITIFGANIVSNTYKNGQGVITFDRDVTTIGSYAFSGLDYDSVNTTVVETSCIKLESIIIPDSVTTIGVQAFYECSSLTSVTIGDGVLEIYTAAFHICENLQEFKGKFASEDSRCLIVDGILNSFAPAGLTEYTIPDSVTEIGNYAFFGCSSLTSVTIPDGVTTIGYAAFAYCGSLTSVTMGEGVETVGGYAFANCPNLNAVHITDLAVWCNIDFINPLTDGNVDFAANPLCNAGSLYLNGELVTDLVIPDGVTELRIISFVNCSNLTSVTIPDSVTIIGVYAFSWCESLTSVTIGDSVTEIGDYAFHYCENLTSVTIPDSVTTIGDDAFRCCSSLTSVTIPDSVTEIGERAFYLCSNLKSLTIPNSVAEIGWGTFCGCYSLTSVTIGNSVTTIGGWAFGDCISLTSITIPDSVTTIGDGAFRYCISLTSITIPDSVTTIGDAAFEYCGSLTSVTIPDSVTEIGNYAFFGCSSLTSVTIPDSVTTIGYATFAYCENLNTVYCKTINPPTIVDNNGYWFGFAKEDESGNICNIDCIIYVPTESVEAYKSAQGWSEYADDIVGYNF